MNVFKLMATLGLDTSEFESALRGAEKIAGGFGSALKNGVGTALKVSGAALTTASAAIVGFAKSSVNAGMQFDSSMSQVAATMGTTVDEIQDLRDFAMEMGANTAFSASQAADALNYMALAGYDAEKSMSMLPNVLNLAAAGGIELARASDMVTDAQSALGLSMDETSALVDKMARASSKSNTSVEQLGDAMLTIGGTAKTLSGGTTELAAALGILADNGIKGAEGGTALRNVLLGIQSGKFTETFGEMGVKAYDAQGNLRDLSDILADMNDVMSNMTEEEKTNLINDTFNRQDLKTVNALLATSKDRWNELSAAIDDSAGAASQMADTQLDNLAGDITLFKSALEGAKITVSDQLTPSLREFVQFGSEGIGKITEAFSEGGLTGAMGELGSFLAEGLGKVLDNLPELIEAASSLVKGIANGIAKNANKLAPAAVKAATAFAKAIISNVSVLLETVQKIVVALATEIGEQLPTLLPAIVEAVVTVAQTLVDSLPELLGAVLTILEGLAQGLLNSLPVLLNALPDIILGIVSFVLDSIPTIVESVITIINAIVDATPTIIQMLVGMLPDIIQKVITSILDHLPEIVQAGIKLLGSLFSADVKIYTEIAKAIPKIITGIVEKLTDPEMMQQIFDTGVDILKKLLEGLKNFGTRIWHACKKIADAIGDFFTQAWEDFKSIGRNVVEGIWEGIKNSAEWIWNRVKEWFGWLFDKIKGFLGIASPSKLFRDVIGKNIVYGIAEGIEEGGDTAIDSMLDLADELVNAADIGDITYRSAIQGSRTINDGDFGNGWVGVGGTTINVYAPKATPAETYAEVVESQQRLKFLGLA